MVCASVPPFFPIGNGNNKWRPLIIDNLHVNNTDCDILWHMQYYPNWNYSRREAKCLKNDWIRYMDNIILLLS